MKDNAQEKKQVPQVDPRVAPAPVNDLASHTDPTQARRRFLKASLIGVPMIVTLRSRPAYAALGSGGVFYCLYGQKSDDGDGTEVWVPVDSEGREMVDHSRGSSETTGDPLTNLVGPGQNPD